MQTEEQCRPSERYLFAEEYFSDRSISIWQKECIKRCKDKPKGAAYEKYINWVRQDNEIAVFTLYAYADFFIPKRFDTIFLTESPDNFIEIEYLLTQSIHEAWLPLDFVDHGHKHLCVFQFEKGIPEILRLLHKSQGKFSTSSKKQTTIGFCNSNDFDEIRARLKRNIELKKQYGDKWCEHEIKE